MDDLADINRKGIEKSMNKCPKCNQAFGDVFNVCPQCGYSFISNVNDDMLPENYVLHGRYIIEKFKYKNEDNWSYYGYDTMYYKKVRIWEFRPCINAKRNNDGSLSYKDNDDILDKKESLLDLFGIYTGLNFLNIITPYDYFEDNNTLYLISERLFGKYLTLEQYIKKKRKISYDYLISVYNYLFESVLHLHKKGIIHEDINPNNIIMNGNAYLLLTNTIHYINKPIYNKKISSGYSALETYSTKEKSGIYTDIYSCAAVIYYMLTGTRPIDPKKRMTQKLKRPSELGVKIPSKAEESLMKGLEVDYKNRQQTMEEFGNDFFCEHDFGFMESVYLNQGQGISLYIDNMDIRTQNSLYKCICDYSVKCDFPWNELLFPPYFKYSCDNDYSGKCYYGGVFELFNYLGERFPKLNGSAYNEYWTRVSGNVDIITLREGSVYVENSEE